MSQHSLSPSALPKPSISVAMCTYNGSKHLIEQLQSFEHQTWLPDEVVICDDNSKDSTVALLREYAENSKLQLRIHVNEQNLGYVANFSKAISLTTGDIVFLSDQDDVWHPQKVEKFVQAFQQNPNVQVLLGDSNLVDERLQFLGQTLWQSLGYDEATLAAIVAPQNFNMIFRRGFEVFSGGGMALRQTLKHDLLPVPSLFAHDLWIGLLAAAIGQLGFVAEPLYEYRQHPKQTSGEKRPGPLQPLRRKMASLSRHRNHYFHQRMLEEHQEIYDRLMKVEKFQLYPGVIDFLNTKGAFLQARFKMRQRPFFLRFLLIYSELISGRYAKAVNGWKSIVVDLVP
jgi:glycosyltransferase involved in cell wall biosynthesis